MRKQLLLLLACILAFPTATRTALIQTELTFNVRNAKGIYPQGTYLSLIPTSSKVGLVNLANGNLILTRPLISRPGRAGFNADISLVYNSKIWERAGDSMVIRTRTDT